LQQIRENKKTTKHRFKVSVGIGKVPVEYKLRTGLQDKYPRFPVTNRGFIFCASLAPGILLVLVLKAFDVYIAYRYIVRMLFPVFSKCWEIWTKPPNVWPVASIVGKCCDWTWHLWLNHIPNRRFTFTMFVICLSCFSRGKQGIGCLPKKSLADELLEELGMKELKKLGLTGLTQSQSQSHPNDRMHHAG
jgi:hypothetical protein